MKKKGFTLIELIVVIAIIGVLAAILVPAMLGYVRKSKVTTANTTAKSIYNAFNTACVDLDTADQSYTIPTTDQTGSSYTSGATTSLNKAVYNYFNDITKVDKFVLGADGGAVTACAVQSGTNGRYFGTYPKQMTVDDNSGKTLATALTYAKG